MPILTRRSLLKSAGSLAGVSVAARGATAQGSAEGPVLTLVCADYVRYMHIASGDVKPDGLTLRWIRGDRTQMLRRAAQDLTVDGGEASMAQHVVRIANGDRSMVAVPIFPLRTSSTACWKCSPERCCVPTCTTRLCFAAASTILRPSKILCEAGFST